MRGGRAGRAALVPAPGLGHVRRRLCLVPSCWPPWSLWVGSLLPLNCLGRAPAAPLAPTHALAGPFVVPSAPAALPSFSVGLTNPVRVSLALGPDVIWTASLTLLKDHSGGSPHSHSVTSSLSLGKITVIDRATNSFTGPSVSDPSYLYPNVSTENTGEAF